MRLNGNLGRSGQGGRYAAGFAAAMSLPHGQVRRIDAQELRRRIRRGGGVLEPESRG